MVKIPVVPPETFDVADPGPAVIKYVNGATPATGVSATLVSITKQVITGGVLKLIPVGGL
ncbi:hypothetical protein D3C85_452170 [compost metagenome]